jgi:hypothetical protein
LLGLKSLATAPWVIALAGKLCHPLCICANFATVFLLVGGNAVAGWVGAFLHVGHFITSARLGCAIGGLQPEKSMRKNQNISKRGS